MWEAKLVEYAPLMIVMGTVIILVFLGMIYNIAKMIFSPSTTRRETRANRKRKKGSQPEADPRQLDDALQRAAVLDQRLQNLEEILAAQQKE